MAINLPIEMSPSVGCATPCAECGGILVAGSDRDWMSQMVNALRDLGYRASNACCPDHVRGMMSGAKTSTVIIESDLRDGEGLDLARTLFSDAARRGQALNAILATKHPTQVAEVSIDGQAMAHVVDKQYCPRQLYALLKLIHPQPVDLQSTAPLSEQIQILSGEIRSLKSTFEQATGKDPQPAVPAPRKPRQIDADLVRKLARAEAARASVIGGKIMGDPAWNILLDLLLASLEGRRVAVSSACIVTGVATTTALRLINRMTSNGVLVRMPDETDGRRDYLFIEPDVEAALKGYLFDLTQL